MTAARADELLQHARASSMRPLALRGRTLLPVVQGGMGVCVSASRLAGTVAGLGAMGVLSALELRRLHPDLMAATAHLDKQADARQRIDAANLEALRREIARARALSEGRGLLAINVMKAVSAYEDCVRESLAGGIDAIVVGAGLPLDLPDLARDHPDVALIPILSDARGVQLLLRKWARKGRLPDAIVIEHPRLAGGHLGAARLAELRDPRFDFERVLPAVRALLEDMGAEREVALIAAGGMHAPGDVLRMQALGADAVQLGTAFAVTRECDAHDRFKQVLAQARPEDMVEFLSVAGLPARAVRTPWLDKYLRLEDKLRAAAHPKRRCNMAFDCLSVCGLRDGLGEMGQFCIDQQLGHALQGDAQRGLFFRGAGPLPFGTAIRPVVDLLRWMVGAPMPVTTGVAASS
ncbi:MAG TPA: nitronate monooxygenase family protein [Hydrogenophaga sp.]|uniref:NAD(P)H-dependent flavin oxidoreductase n=1 Tax=Hydrogenophaga sp. TaxID=1904254 RepID=UPI002CEEE285|nr:nitronate monooxygenase family protein [Hydrogenophaga sp.]HSX93896.1 nitronate monooxygenase family protein [Hydrogenophaga sp.]